MYFPLIGKISLTQAAHILHRISCIGDHAHIHYCLFVAWKLS